MTSKTAKSRIFNKAKKAATRQWKQSRKKEAQVAGGGQLPAGIVGGTAILVNKDWRETDKKVPFLLLQYTVVEPEDYEGVKQSVSYFFADTKFKKIQDVTDRLSSDIQLMGIDTDGMEIEDLDSALDDLVEAKAAIKFNTRGGKLDNGNDWFKFDVAGAADDYEPDTEDDEDDEPEPDDDDTEDDEDEDTEKDESEDDEDESESEDDGGDDDAAEDDEDEWVPEAGEIYNYKPPRGKKAAECEVLTVDEKAETATVKRLSDGKKFTKVSWDALEGEEESPI